MGGIQGRGRASQSDTAATAANGERTSADGVSWSAKEIVLVEDRPVREPKRVVEILVDSSMTETESRKERDGVP